ncbi:hypothetical protein B0T19DRAFT_440697 [Cercophora scortea]|uniref:LRR-containing protein second PH domain-containing protein n=1 Tax=Cercophora scortea TaxID=314031 RepID=A0AAE0J001_9PEZI|nr:hypothetical protein B0T19DRAFT_440697 [Cercophora scortea]
MAMRPFSSRDSICETGNGNNSNANGTGNVNGSVSGTGISITNSNSTSSTSSSNASRARTRTPSAHGRKLSKSRNLSTSTFDALTRRSSGYSGYSDDRRMSVAESVSAASSSSIDWKLQNVEGVAPLESDTQLLKTKTPYLVVTTDYVVKLKNHAHVLALFPQLSEGARPEPSSTVAEPLAVIPVAGIISVFVAESTRPSFGLEIWWKTLSGASFHHASFFFNLPTERDEQMHHIVCAMRSNNPDENEFNRRSVDVAELLQGIQDTEEPKFKHQKIEIFPVVPRGNTRRDCSAKPEDDSKKSLEGPAFYLAVGGHLCYLVEIQKGKGGNPICQHRTFGLVTLEKFKGDWTHHQERFNITFRDPFSTPVVLELASRYYRNIILTFGQADRFLKPAWPQMWQGLEIFRISGLKQLQSIISREDFGSVRRTLDAFLSAYRCNPVVWEINWRSKFAPEFRLLPAKDGSTYSALQILAVLRALRYNDYFNSLSFRDIDLAVLWHVEDNPTKLVNVAYLSRSCVTLDPDEVEILKISPVLHQEFHALAFCSETIRQIDFTNSSASYVARFRQSRQTSPSIQFIAPILNLLKSGITKCNRLILSRTALLRADIEEIAEILKHGSIQALDVSFCGLDDMDLRDMVVTPLLDHPQQLLQSLDVSGNPGRVPARILSEMIHNLVELRELNLCGSLQGDVAGPLIPVETLDRLQFLTELDISNFKLNLSTLVDLERFLSNRASKMDANEPASLHKLVLNNCGITGGQAARIFNAIGENHGMDLSISGNPIEDGVDDLAAAISKSRAPASLTMQMVEFRIESNYVLLIKSLTKTKYLSMLNLVGTAPNGPCSAETVRALEDFFAHNKSIQCLDLSGYCGKLDDGQLAKGFGRSLLGLIKNTTMTHFRIRNQNLHDDAGILGRVIRENRHLMVFDCQDNNLNLTSLQFLVSNLKHNTNIIEFPFSATERAAIWNNILSGLHRTSRTLSLPFSGSASAAAKHADKNPLKMQEKMLREVFNGQFGDLDIYLRRNRIALEESSGHELDFESPAADHRGPGGAPDDSWPALELKAMGVVPHGGQPHGHGGDMGRGGRATVRSSNIPFDTSLPEPYRVVAQHEGTESPTETLDPVSEISTPPLEKEIVAGLTDGEEVAFRRMMSEFKETGFGFS